MTRPKKDSQERRVILDLSWPIHASVNGGTPLEAYMDEPYKLLLPTVDDFAHVLAVFGTGTYMWTLDLSRAYRQIRIDPLDWPLICLSWQDQYYINISVAFGVRHGAAFTQRLSQAVCDILDREDIFSIPYIDDYIGARPSLDLATEAYDRSLQLFGELGLVLNPSKCVTPTTSLTWIGVTYDSLTMTMYIPLPVIADTQQLVTTWLHRTTASRHDLQVLLGKLFHAGKCCPASRIFVGRMLITLRSATSTGVTTLSPEFQADLLWWRDMLPTYNGRLLIQLHRPTYHLHIDIHGPTLDVSTYTHITTIPIPLAVATTDHKWAHRECFAVLISLLLWGSQWAQAELCIHCTTPHKLMVLVHGRSRNAAMLDIGRRIWLITAHLDICLNPVPQGSPTNINLCVVQPPDFSL
jgi:hypothetical protein